MPSHTQQLTPWRDLSPERQTELRQLYQAELDTNPRTCSLDEKMNRFTKWLAEQGVSFSMDDLRRPKKD